MNLPKMIRSRYEVLSDIGVDGLKQFIELKESGLEYWEATKQMHLNWFKDNKKMTKRILKIEWKP